MTCDEERSAIAAFWDWWAKGGALHVDLAREASEPGEALDKLLTERVHAIHPGLRWEVGDDGVLVVTAEGDHDALAPAARWLASAPAPDETWSFADLRPAGDADSEVSASGVTIDLARCVAGVQVAGQGVNVTLHHPIFAGQPAEVRRALAELALEQVLGEEDAALWLGAVSASEVEPLDAFALSLIPSVIAQVRPPDDELNWAALKGEDAQGREVVALAEHPLRQITGRRFDTYASVEVRYGRGRRAGLPGRGDLKALTALHDRLDHALGDDGRVVAHQSSAGVRIIHLFIDGCTDAAERLGAVVASERSAEVSAVVADPGWSRVRHLAG
ncbi:hypothetical protein [Janibacter sp. GXQ6167]|uniref:hypothetical protein n=1 Tax=Janibacter sp. GXQ6167 TaxID=3240791 RepID=UPI003523C3AA